MREAIGHLPSLESGEKSNIKNHYSRTHTEAHIRFMKHTPTGNALKMRSTILKMKTGKRLKDMLPTYKRMDWDKPSNDYNEK